MKSNTNLGLTSLTEFGTQLSRAESEEEFTAVIKTMLEKGPAALDIEIRSLGPEGGGTLTTLSQFLTLIQTGFKSNQNFEAIQSYLSLFLKLHGETIGKEESLVKTLKEIQSLQEEKWSQINEEIDESLCLVKFFKSSFLS